MRAASFVLSLILALLATGCEPTADAQTSEIRERLVGTWLRDYDENGTHVRRILVLAPDGHFQEVSRTLGPDEAGTRHEHEGDWVYDGTNLKRKYTRIDGKPPGAPTVPFAAFQIEFSGSHDFTGIDNVRHRELRYHRVPDGTMP
jgi:hypothetical protein